MRFHTIRRAFRSFSLAPLPSVVTLFDSTRPWEAPPHNGPAR